MAAKFQGINGLKNSWQKLSVSHISWHELAKMVGPAILILAAAFRIASRYIKSSPPSTLTMTTGFAGSPYALFAQRYQDVLASDGVTFTLTLVPSHGASENLTRLRDPKQAVDVGPVQGGMATRAKGQSDERLPEDSPKRVSLGSLVLCS